MALLKPKGAALECDGYTPLMAASEHGTLESVKWLLDRGARVDATALVPASEQSALLAVRSAVIYAARRGHLEAVHMLHARGASFIAHAGGRHLSSNYRRVDLS